MLVTCEEMKRAEEAAFARGVQAEDLMEEAGRGIAEIVRQFHPDARALRRVLRQRPQCRRRAGGRTVSRLTGDGASTSI